jgi:hypothetical protein
MKKYIVRKFIVLLLIFSPGWDFALDQRTVNLISHYIDLSNKTSPDAKPLVSIIAGDTAVFMQERKFDPDTGAEMTPLLTQIDTGSLEKFQNDITVFTDALPQIQEKTAQAVDVINSKPIITPPVILDSTPTAK